MKVRIKFENIASTTKLSSLLWIIFGMKFYSNLSFIGLTLAGQKQIEEMLEERNCTFFSS